LGLRWVVEKDLIVGVVGMCGVLIQIRQEIDLGLPNLVRMRVAGREVGILLEGKRALRPTSSLA
jgi:hypothetical protein